MPILGQQLYGKVLSIINHQGNANQNHKEKKNPNTTLKMVIKSQEKRTKEERKKKDLQKQIQNN